MNIRSAGPVQLSYTDAGQGSSAVILLHGYGCDRSFLAAQAEFLARRQLRVISPDLRGHGQSPAPEGDYDLATLASDVKHLCDQLELKQVAVVGHSMGGVVGLHLAALTDYVTSLVLIDSFLFPPEALAQSFSPTRAQMREPTYDSTFRHLMAALAATGQGSRCPHAIDLSPRAPQHVLIAALEAQFDQTAAKAAAQVCRIPVAYIGAAASIADLDAFREHTPQLLTAKTLASGHFSPVCVPAQVNAMLADFLELAGASEQA